MSLIPAGRSITANALPPIGVILWAASLMKCEEHLQAGADAMEQRVRICDIAEELGLSTATVSNVIHGKTNKVSDATVQRDLAGAKPLRNHLCVHPRAREI